MTIRARLALLETVQADAVSRFQQQPFQVRRRVLDTAAHQLIRQGHLPPVDPDHPDMPLETQRREHPEAFLAWHAATFASEAWFAQHHPAVRQAFFQALREEHP